MYVGSRLRELRKQQGLTGKDLEKLSGIGQATISRIEKNETSPTLTTLTHLCRALEVPLIEFLDAESYSPETLRLIRLFQKLTPVQRKRVIEMLDSFVNRP